MASLVLGTVGAIVGGIYGGPSGASLGWTVGSTLGSIISPTKLPNVEQQGPRLGDLKVQASTYGNFVPIVYGSMRLAGNMIWSTPIVETQHVSTQSSGGGGKGGPKQQVTQYTYTYSQSFAIALCEGPIVGLRKIWANGELVYNLSDGTDSSTASASQTFAGGLRIYLGTETQMPDALIQANVGITACPAYRGTAYLVFENLQLEKFGNRLPNFEFEVTAETNHPMDWYTVTLPFPAGVITWSDAVYANGLYTVISSADNNCASSTDGLWYQQSYLPVTANWTHVSYKDGMYVATPWSSTSAYATSIDGVNWTAQVFPTSGYHGKVAVGNGLFLVAEYSTGIALTSTDGINWTQHAMPVGPYYAATYGNGLFVCVKYTGDSVAISPDGVSWSEPQLPVSAQWQRIEYGNGMFLIIAYDGKTAYSYDGITWEQGGDIPLAAYGWMGLAFGDGLFVAVGNNAYSAWTRNGITWTSVAIPSFAASQYYGVAYGNGQFLAVGYAASSSWPDFLLSVPPTTPMWKAEFALGSSGMYPNGLVYGNGYFFSSDFQGLFRRSADGINWESILVGYDNDPIYGSVQNYQQYGISFGNGVLCMGCNWGQPSYANHLLVSRDNGQSWRRVPIPGWNPSFPLPGALVYPQYYRTIYGDGKFVAITNGGPWDTSSAVSFDNGATWNFYGLIQGFYSEFQEGSYNGSGVGNMAFGNGVFLAPSHGNQCVYTSSDGRWWETTALQFQPLWVVFGSGLFFATDGLQAYATSPNGTNWTYYTIPNPLDAALNIGASEDGFVILGAWGQVWKSSDCINWHLQYGSCWGNTQLEGVAYGENTWVGIANHFYDLSNRSRISYFKDTTATIAAGSILLADVVADICIRSALNPSQIDVTELTDIVDGYMITHQATGRSGIEPLMQVYYFDAVESDGKVKYVKRGHAPALSIVEDDLAAHEHGTEMPDQLVLNRKQEMELPLEISVQYMDKDASYLVGSQYARRLIGSSNNKVPMQYAVSLDADKAKQVADVLLYDAWTTRTAFQFAISNKYAYLEPTDVIQVTKNGTAYTARLVDKDEATGIHNYSAVLEDISIYSQNASGASLTPPVTTLDVISQTLLLTLDIPLLRDQDDNVGFYAVACGYKDNWPGCQLFKSSNNGSSWDVFGNPILHEAAIGWTKDTLGDFHSGHIFDEFSSVTVKMTKGALSSATELDVLNGANAALIENEIVQYKNAVLIAPDTYTLSGFLRGLRGTEAYISDHGAGDAFVVLTETTVYLEAGASERNLYRLYRPVTFGQFINDAYTYYFTNLGVSQRCYSPVHIGGGRNASGDVIINWQRRGRINGAWNDYIDVPLGEASERYEVLICPSTYASIVRTITSTTPTVTYTAAQQVTDFGMLQPIVYVSIRQLSSSTDDGEYQRATI